MDRIRIVEVAGSECFTKMRELRDQYPTTGLYPFLMGSVDEREWFESADRVTDEQVAEIVRAGEALDGEDVLRARRAEYDAIMGAFEEEETSLDEDDEDEDWEDEGESLADDSDSDEFSDDSPEDFEDEDDGDDDPDDLDEDDFPEDPHWDDDQSVRTGPGSGPVLHKDAITGAVFPKVLIGLAKIAQPWHLPAVLPFGGWNECPTAAEHVAVMKLWHERHGAEITGMSHDTIECTVARPPADPGAAMDLALEQEAYCCDIVLQAAGSAEELAEELENSTYWYFWWD